MKVIDGIQQGKHSALEVFLPPKKRTEADPKPTPAVSGSDGDDRVGFTCLDFPKGAIGQKNIKSFFGRLLEAYKAQGISLVNQDMYYKVNKTQHHWDSLVARVAIYFETVAVTGDKSKDKKVHSQCVHGKPSECLSRSICRRFSFECLELHLACFIMFYIVLSCFYLVF